MNFDILNYEACEPINLAIVGDLHVNSTVGLAPENFRLDDGIPVGQSNFQKKLWEAWTDYWACVGSLDGQTVGILNGDLMEGEHHGTTQVITGNIADQHRMVLEVLKPGRNVVSAWFVMRGTEVHTNKSSRDEEMIAIALDAVQDYEGSRSRWFLRADFGGVRFDIGHHVPFSRLAWTRSNLLMRTAIEIELDYYRAGIQPPQFAIRSHRHQWGDTGISAPVRVISLPCWQGPTSYVHSLRPGMMPEIGGIIVRIENGQANVIFKNYSARTSWIT